jgi:hypothetical protein
VADYDDDLNFGVFDDAVGYELLEHYKHFEFLVLDLIFVNFELVAIFGHLIIDFFDIELVEVSEPEVIVGFVVVLIAFDIDIDYLLIIY